VGPVIDDINGKDLDDLKT